MTIIVIIIIIISYCPLKFSTLWVVIGSGYRFSLCLKGKVKLSLVLFRAAVAQEVSLATGRFLA